MKDTTFCFGALGAACLMLAVWSVFGQGSKVEANAAHAENPIKGQRFEVGSTTVVRYYDQQTGVVCYELNKSGMFACSAVKWRQTIEENLGL